MDTKIVNNIPPSKKMRKSLQELGLHDLVATVLKPNPMRQITQNPFKKLPEKCALIPSVPLCKTVVPTLNE